MDNNYLSLFSFLLSDSKRLQLTPIMNKLTLDYPYDMLWLEMKKLKEDITKQDLLEIVKSELTADDYLYFKEMPEQVSNTIGYRSLQRINSQDNLTKIN